MLGEAYVTEPTDSPIPTPSTLPILAILPSLVSLATQPSDTKKSDSELIGLRIRLLITRKGIFAVIF